MAKPFVGHILARLILAMRTHIAYTVALVLEDPIFLPAVLLALIWASGFVATVRSARAGVALAVIVGVLLIRIRHIQAVVCIIEYAVVVGVCGWRSG